MVMGRGRKRITGRKTSVCKDMAESMACSKGADLGRATEEGRC